MAEFDQYQSRLWGVIRRVYGDEGTWTPSAGAPVTGLLLLRSPTQEERLTMYQDYYTEFAVIEWEKGQFAGLYEASRGDGVGANPQTVNILGVDYLTQRAMALADGKTYKAVIIRA